MPTIDKLTGTRTGIAQPIQIGTFLIGATFALVGVAGFIPGLTTNIGDLAAAGRDSEAELLGLFQVSILHNFVHLGFGIGLFASRTVSASRLYLLGGGVLYLVLTLYGVVIDLGDPINFVPINTADNWLHLGLGIAMIVGGLVLGAMSRTTGTVNGQPTKADLYDQARAAGIDGRSSMDKSELEEAVLGTARKPRRR
jgi:hypothetical protein